MRPSLMRQRPSRSNLVRALVAVLCFCAATSLAQGRGGGPPPGGGGPPGGGMGGGGMGGGGMNEPPPFGSPGNGPGNSDRPTPPAPPPPRSQSNEGPMREGLQLGPPGEKWWDDKSFAKNLKLRPEQQTRMDAVFEENKTALLSSLQNLQKAESQMNEVAKSPNPDEAALFTQIDRVAQARADLEKANTHMLLQIRKEMDADQIARLEKRR